MEKLQTYFLVAFMYWKGAFAYKIERCIIASNKRETTLSQMEKTIRAAKDLNIRSDMEIIAVSRLYKDFFDVEIQTIEIYESSEDIK